MLARPGGRCSDKRRWPAQSTGGWDWKGPDRSAAPAFAAPCAASSGEFRSPGDASREGNELLHTALELTTNKGTAHVFFAELREKHDIDDAVFLIDGSHSLKDACRRHSLDFRYERHGNQNSVGRVFREIKRRTTSSSDCFSNAEADTADDWLRSFAFAWNQLI